MPPSFCHGNGVRVRLSRAAALACLAGVWAAGAGAAAPAAPGSVATRAGDQSVILRWNTRSDTDRCHIYRFSPTGLSAVRLTESPIASSSYVDFDVTNGQFYSYAVRVVDPAGVESADSPRAGIRPKAFASDAAFLDYLQQTAFDFFWHEANPANGLVRDRSAAASPCSIAAVGFGFTALCVGVERGWVSRPEAAERARVTLRTFWNQPQGPARSGCIGYQGWFYHFLDMHTAGRVWNCELSSIDTALLLAGMLDARGFFDRDNAGEAEIRRLVTAIYDRVNWRWMADGGNILRMGWHPETGFLRAQWIGYNEAMILYLLALGARSNAVPAAHWQNWTRGYAWSTNYGLAYVQFAPLFGHQYSHCWIDFRRIADPYLQRRGLTYFENSRRATLAQRAYAIENPKGFAGYSSNVWGLTACDGPPPPGHRGYHARGAPSGGDDGTIAPTAAGGSIPFAPEFALPALRHMYSQFRTRIWTAYGFRDAFNLGADWWGPDVLGIDQGPILIMAENYLTGSVWNRFMKTPEIQRGLEQAGFAELSRLPRK